MHPMILRVGVPVVCIALAALLSGARAQGGKATDGGKAEEFKAKTFALKEKEKAAIILTFPAGKEAAVTVRSEKKTDVHLFVYDAGKKVVAKDDSPGPTCDLTFTPKEGGQYTLEVRNLGPGENSATLKVEFAKAKGKSEGNN
jgi:hypothetical protein